MQKKHNEKPKTGKKTENDFSQIPSKKQAQITWSGK